jgi:peptidyl-prolyl cis-trans isomerase B (cyclophilin B)
VRLHIAGADGASRGTLLLELYEDDAPNAVANFVSLVERGFYVGTRFHWVEGSRRVIGGDPNSKDDDPANDGYGGPGYRIEPEPSRRLNLRHTIALSDERGARRSEGSSFLIHLEAFPALDGVTSVIGRVIEGFETLRAIEYYDVIKKAEVVRKRDHDYNPVTR